MNKLPLVVMAVLCTLLTACDKEALVSDSNFDLTIEKRSVESISVEYTTLEQNTTTVNCSKVEVDYYDDTSALLLFVFDDNTTQEVYATEVYVSTIPQNILDVTVDNSNFDTSDITVSVDGNQLSYANSDENKVGSGLGIIIEDDPLGI